MSLFPAKKKSGGRDGGGASTIAGSTSEETTPLFPKIGRTPTNYVDFGSSGGGGGDDGSGRDGGSSRSGGGGDEFPELFDKSTRFKSMTRKERELIFGVPNVVPKRADAQLHELVYQLFEYEHHHSHAHPRTNPQLPPEKRFSRHRNFYVYQLNQFRHWWKTSRLLVRLTGGIIYAIDALNWTTMAMWHTAKQKQAKHALKQMKTIGQGGVIRLFLQVVHPFTRTIRIVLAVARAWEARVDNRLYEVGLAEGFAFMGNRCARYWTRRFVDWFTAKAVFPMSALVFEPYFDQNSRPFICLMGFLRAILPFAASFQGSRFGRQVTFNTYKYAFYRWKSAQSIMTFHEHTGTYQDTNLDPLLLGLARKVAVGIGHGTDPEETRLKLNAINFKLFGSGAGGYSVYQMDDEATDMIILLHVTPYGPSILDEMPRFIILERRKRFYVNRLASRSDGIILDAATPRQAKVRGFTYSGAFFQMQEWAALKTRYDRELFDYSEACHKLGTRALPKNQRNPQETKVPAPPTDLASLKALIRGGRQNRKQRRDNARWRQIQAEVKKMAALVGKYQKNGTAPKRVILYLEGLDCAGKSSTGFLICQALEKCGYAVTVAQHNRPPTPEQRQKPWMDRIRFEYPDDMYPDGDCPEYASVVWDRGPAGDFVYGKLDDLPPADKLKKYNEFRRYDYICHQEGVLFFKCFFVSSRDAIAATLGKRLAQKKIARDLRVWLDANSVAQYREGLEEIELHIDPTDFVAFNKYEENLSKFAEVARNTNTIGRLVGTGSRSSSLPSDSYDNPWLVINTSDRHAARLNMMNTFRRQLQRFAETSTDEDDLLVTEEFQRGGVVAKIKSLFTQRGRMDDLRTTTTYAIAVPSNIVEEKEHGLSVRAVLQSFVLFLLFYAYAYQTWNFVLEDIT